jgi:chemotaxis protein CheC
MSTELHLGKEQIDALREIGNIGAGNAATALSQMTGCPVQMGIPTVKLLPVEEIAGEVGAADDIVAAMFLGVEGDAPGHMLFVMSERAARTMVDLLMGSAGQESVVGAFSEIELSALQEVSNIMTGSYLSALAQITGLRLEPTPPAVGVDFAGALLGSALSEIAMVSEKALLLESTLGDDETPSVGDFLFIPTTEALTIVLERLGVGE